MGILDLIKEGCYSSCHVNSALGWECHQQKNCPCCSKVALKDLWLPRLVWILSGLRDTHGSCSKQLSAFGINAGGICPLSARTVSILSASGDFSVVKPWEVFKPHQSQGNSDARNL